MSDYTRADILAERKAELVAMTVERNELRKELERTRDALAKVVRTSRRLIEWMDKDEYQKAMDEADRILGKPPQPKGA